MAMSLAKPLFAHAKADVNLYKELESGGTVDIQTVNSLGLSDVQ